MTRDVAITLPGMTLAGALHLRPHRGEHPGRRHRRGSPRAVGAVPPRTRPVGTTPVTEEQVAAATAEWANAQVTWEPDPPAYHR